MGRDIDGVMRSVRPRFVPVPVLVVSLASLAACSGPQGSVAAPSAPAASSASTAPGAADPATPAPSAADTELAAKLDARLAAEGEAFSGVVLVARDGVPIYQKAVGLADREHGRPNTLGTRFNIASMGKMFTAVAVMQLVQAGKVRLDAPLGTYLTDYPNQDIAHRVTLHQLLTHTGGTGDIFGPEFAEHRGQMRSLQDYVALYGTRPPLFEPGSRWMYSNYGFVLLGRVIEQVSGQSYYDYVAEHIFSPAGMTHTDLATRDGTGTDTEDRAIGYTRRSPEGGQPQSLESSPNTSFLTPRASSAGGADSTVGDLLAFANALENHRLLDAQHTELMLTGKAPMPDGGKYAYGFSDATNDGVRCFGHNGGGPGVSSLLRVCRAPGETSSHLVAVLTNLDPPAGMELMRAVRARFAPNAAASADAAATNTPTPAKAAKTTRPCQDISLDDFEDGDVSVSPSGLGSSRWHSYHDLSGSTVVPAGDLGATRSNDSKFAAHISGKLARARFAWAGVAIQPSDMSAPYDLSPWTAVCFRARGSGTMRFDVSDVNTTPEGGVCRRCYDVFGANVTLSEGWAEHCIPLDSLASMGWGVPPQHTLTSEKVFGLSWSMHTPGSTYDLWVDDVRLMCRSAK